jgi:hypothetical protein
MAINGSLAEKSGARKTFFADEVLGLFVIRQAGVDHVDWKRVACGNAVSSRADYRQLALYSNSVSALRTLPLTRNPPSSG